MRTNTEKPAREAAMIAQLFRTKFESNLMSFIVFIALIAYAGVRYAMTGTAPDVGNPQPELVVMTAYAVLMMFCLVPGVISLLRKNRERSGRLYAHLPVSPLQLRVAYWLHAGLYFGIAASMLMVFVVLAGSGAAWEYLLPLVFVFHIGTLLACFSLVTSNLSRVLPEFVRRNTILYCVVVAVATVALGAGVALAATTLFGRYEGPESWPTLAAEIGTACVALVALDIYLFGKTDHSLG
jgi:hypothetical protein